MKKKILFFIHDLGHGGAEKVLVNLVNNMNPNQFDITVLALFGGGVNEQFLKPHIHYQTVFKHVFPGNSHIMKLFSNAVLHKYFIKDDYDIEVAYLEGPAARIISGCQNKKTKLVSWIHCTMKTENEIAIGFRDYDEAKSCYEKMNSMVFVSETVRDAFLDIYPFAGQTVVLYNTNETEMIIEQSLKEVHLSEEAFCWCGVGKIIPIKGFDRMIRIQKRFVDEGYKIHLYLLGEGQQKNELQKMVSEYGINDSVTFLGYQTNPYKYVAKCDLFVCASHSEGFSTAATEALIVGTPVCTVEVAGMKELLGDNNKYGLVTVNDEAALYQGIKLLLDDKKLLDYYKEKARERGKSFNTKTTVSAVEQMLLVL